jgi:hypothetical protein
MRSPLLLVLVAACTAPDPIAEGGSALESENALTANALTWNALTKNSLTKNSLTRNSLTENSLTENSLTKNALTSPVLTPGGATEGQLARTLLRYQYSCAQPSGTSMQLVIDGVDYGTYQGQLGLAPERGVDGGACDETCQRWVTACVLARVNYYGVPIGISLRGAHPALTVSTDEAAAYPEREGSYFGNMFADTTQRYACAGPLSVLGAGSMRRCSAPGGGCGIDVLASCHGCTYNPESTCEDVDGDQAPDVCFDQPFACSGGSPSDLATSYGEVITVYLPPRGLPMAEINNDVDDNLDGLVDEGFYVCHAAEMCNGVDDDCDGWVDEAFGVGRPCLGAGGDPLRAGILQCSADHLSSVCVDPTATGVEFCNGLDDDGDGLTDEDFNLHAACDWTTDSDLCMEGTTSCLGLVSTQCSDLTSNNVEACNGIDDNCDGQVDEGYSLGQACDGIDADLCRDGAIICSATGGMACGDDAAAKVERCNGLDDDCDGQLDEGYSLGVACDGSDGDLCKDGVVTCSVSGGTVCSDDATAKVERCNGVDDDCDLLVDEGYAVGTSCDGADGDLCREGVTICTADGLSTSCNDLTDNTLEIRRNLVDDDCDGLIDERK